MKKHFWKIEYSITLFVLIGFLMLLIPLKFENYLQAMMITQWKDSYKKITYTFNVINTQKNDEIIKSFSKNHLEQRERMLKYLIKPYLRLHSMERIPWRYKPKYLNGTRVGKKDDFYFDELYFNERTIVGIKDILNNKENDAWFMMMVDINGLLPPNRWGKDIYGVYIYDEGKVVPFGYDKSMDKLQSECSKNSKGLTCSYYYLIGGEFND